MESIQAIRQKKRPPGRCMREGEADAYSPVGGGRPSEQVLRLTDAAARASAQAGYDDSMIDMARTAPRLQLIAQTRPTRFANPT